MGNSNNNRLAELLGLPKNAKIEFNPHNNNILTSVIGDGNGNYNRLRLLLSRTAPTIKQEIITNGNRYNY